MARTVEVRLIDDIDEGPADESVRFGLDGIDYEIDLSTKNANKLRAVLAAYIERGTRQGKARVGRANGRGPASQANREENEAIRAWAHDRGLYVAPRGRIKQEIIDAYRKRNDEPEATNGRGRRRAKAVTR